MVMLMLQSSIAALTSHSSRARPSELLVRLNTLMFENIRHRLDLDDHVTLSLIHYTSDGRLSVAGAHEVMLVHRARTGRCERFSPQGTWIGAMPDIGPHTTDSVLELEKGDLLVLYTDGITEAMDARHQQYGLDRLCTAVEHIAEQPVGEVCNYLVDSVSSFMDEQKDDLSIVVLRYQGTSL
jgi:serine phosphatase RsbU (regulator of sigma subunit)